MTRIRAISFRILVNVLEIHCMLYEFIVVLFLPAWFIEGATLCEVDKTRETNNHRHNQANHYTITITKGYKSCFGSIRYWFKS